MSETEIKQQVRQFYDQVGWQTVEGGVYQNARYEDLRPVSAEYIHRCHLRVNRHIAPSGRFLLDAGSGPVQYPEYQSYSQGYTYRVCADLSIVALQEARKRLGQRGLYVVADVAHLPFKADAFDGIVSLHTLHHLPPEDHEQAYHDLYRVLAPGRTAAIVNGWTESPLMRSWNWAVVAMERLQGWLRRQKPAPKAVKAKTEPTGTFIQKFNPDWLKRTLGGRIPFEIWVWRSVNVRFLRALVHRPLGGRWWLRWLYALEERFPHYYGERGQYPLIVLRKE